MEHVDHGRPHPGLTAKLGEQYVGFLFLATQPVLVNLGTNDGLPAKATQEQWIAAMLQLGRRYGKNTPVVVICGPWFSTGPVVDYNRAAVEAAREQGYDFHLYVLPSGTVQRNTTSCGGHPEADAQEAMGDQLTAVVQQLLGWDLGPPTQTVV